MKHATTLRTNKEEAAAGPVSRVNDFIASKLAIVFGLAWTIWVFFVWPLVVQALPVAVQNKTFYYASGWIQLFALPLMVYVGNKLQRSADAQADANFEAMTHIANTVDGLARDVADLKAKYLK